MPISDELLKLAADGYTNELVNGDVVSMALELREARLIVSSIEHDIQHVTALGGNLDRFIKSE